MCADHPLALGIDFGTSNSCAGFYDGQNVKLLPIDRHNKDPEVVKTILYITREQKYFIGQEAVEMYYKQNIGRPRHFVKVWSGEIEFYGGEMYYVRDIYAYEDEYLPGRLLQYLKTALRNPWYEGTRVFDTKYSIEELAAVFLKAMKKKTEAFTNTEIYQVVLGRPIHFANSPEDDKKAELHLKNAAHLAGFTDVHFEYEPVAAALEYESTITSPQNILVFDFGGGTLDITIMKVGGECKRHIYATGGVDIAGSLFDTAIIDAKMLHHFGYDTTYGSEHIPFPQELVQSVSDWFVLPTLGTPENKILLDKAMYSSNHPCRIENLRSLIFNEYGYSFYNKVEQAKIELSSEYCSTIDFRGDGISVWQMLTRSQFEAMIETYVKSVIDCLNETLDNSGLAPSEINRIVTTGGSSRIPIFNQMLAQIFGESKIRQANVFTSVTAGLAIKAYEIFNGT